MVLKAVLSTGPTDGTHEHQVLFFFVPPNNIWAKVGLLPNTESSSSSSSVPNARLHYELLCVWGTNVDLLLFKQPDWVARSSIPQQAAFIGQTLAPPWGHMAALCCPTNRTDTVRVYGATTKSVKSLSHRVCTTYSNSLYITDVFVCFG